MRLFGGLPSFAKVLRRAGLALGALLCVGAMATPAAAQMTALASLNPSAVDPGEPATLTITIDNSNPGAAVTGTGFNIDLRANPNSKLQVLDAGQGNAGVKSLKCFDAGSSTPKPGIPANGTGIVTAVVGATTISMSGATIPSGSSSNGVGSCLIEIIVSSGQNGTNSLAIPTGAVQGTDDHGPIGNTGVTPTQNLGINNFTPPTIEKEFTGTAAVLGVSNTLRIRIKNNSTTISLPLNGLSDTPDNYGLLDNLAAADMAVANSPNASISPSCAGSTLSAAPNATEIRLTGGTIAPGATCTITVDVVGTAIGLKTNAINATTQFHTKRLVAAQANATDTLDVTSSLRVTTSFLPSPIPVDRQGTFTVNIENAGGVVLNQTGTFHDIVGRFDIAETQGAGAANEGLLIQGAAPVSVTNCGSPAINIDANTKGYTMTGAVFQPGQTCTLVFNFKGILVAALTAEQDSQTFTHFILQDALNTTQGVKNAEVRASIGVYNSLVPDKYILDASDTPITDPNLKIAGGQIVKYKLTIGNFGTSPAKLVVTDRLPAGMKIINTAPRLPIYQGDTPACSGSTNVSLDDSTPERPVWTYTAFPGSNLNDARRCDIFFYAQVPTTLPDNTSLANTIAPCDLRLDVGSGAISGGADPSLGTGLCAIRGTGAVGGFAAPIAIDQAFAPTTQQAGQPVTLTFTLTNFGGTTLQNAQFTNTFLAGMKVYSTPGIVNNCGGTFTALAGATSVSLTGGLVGPRANGGLGSPNGECTISVQVTGNPGVYQNRLEPQAFEGDQTQPVGPALPIKSANQPNFETVTFEAALTADKVFSPNVITSGGTSRVTVTLSNGSTGPYNNVGFNDTQMAAGMTVLSTPLPGTTCDGPTSFIYTNGGNTFGFRGANLPAGGSCTVSFTVTATGTSVPSWTNTIPVNEIFADGGIRNVSAISAVLNRVTQDIGISNVVNPSTLRAPGEAGTLTVTLTNNGTAEVTGVGVTQYLTLDGEPGGAELGVYVAAQASPSTTCSGASVQKLSDKAVSLSGARIPGGGGQCSFEFKIIQLEVGIRNIIIPLNKVTSNEGATNRVEDASTPTNLPGRLGIEKSFTPRVIKPNVPTRLRVTLFNLLTQDVQNLRFTDIMPSGVLLTAAPDLQQTCGGTPTGTPGGNSLGLTGGFLAGVPVSPPLPAPANPATKCYVEAWVTASATNRYSNLIDVGDLDGDAVGLSSTSPVDNPVETVAELLVAQPIGITKTFANDIRTPGQANLLTISLQNPNNYAIAGGQLVDNLPSGVSIAPTPGAGSTNCGAATVTAVASANTGSISNATLPAGGTCEFHFNVVSNTPATYTNTIPAGSLYTFDGVTNENPAQDDFLVQAPPTVLKEFSPPVIPVSGTSTLTITLGNTNATPITLTSIFTDPLPTSPGAITVNGAASGTCTTHGTVIAANASNAVSYASGGTIPSGGCTIVVPVTGNTVGVHVNEIAAGSLQTTASFNVQPTTANLEISPKGFITGRVFRDDSAPADGVFNGADAGLPNITLTLTGIDYGLDGVAGGTDDTPFVAVTKLTDAAGNYLFSNLNPGSYTVTETEPSGMQNGITTAGTPVGSGSSGVATGIGTTPSVISNIILLQNAGQTGGSVNNNFAEVALNGTISGRVFLDLDNDGIFDAGESGIGSVTINLSGPTPGTTQTANDGTYSFTGLAVGTYTVTEPNQPPSTANGITTAGSVGATATAVNVLPSAISGIVLTSISPTSTGNNFGEKAATAPPTNSPTISGRVYNDANDNGVVDSDETGIPGVTVALTGTDINGNPVSLSTTTDANGNYAFTPPQSNPAGYTITETQPGVPDGKTTAPTGTAASTKPVATNLPDTITGVVFGTTAITGYNFGERSGAIISGKVYKDLNDNGVADAGEDGIPGVTVTLTGTNASGGAVSLTTTTNAFGAYSFTAPPSNAAGYTITEIQPTEFADGKTTAPGVGTVASSKPVAGGGADTITGVILTTNPLSGFNFGELVSTTKVTGYVFADAGPNPNGVKDAGEAGIEGVTVTLTGTSAAGTAVSLTTVTAADGTFTFNNVPVSNAAGYTITEVQPTGYTDGRTIVTTGQPGTPNSSKQVNVGDQDRVIGVVVPANTNRGDYIFAEFPVPGLKPPIVNGYVYLDRRHTRVRPTDGSIEGQVDWTVTLRQNGQVICTTTTNAKGFYQFDNLHCPGYELSGLPTGSGFSITFDKDGSNLPAVPTSGGGRGTVDPTGGQILNITLLPSDQVVEQNLPLDPAGVIYDSVKRTPVPGAVITIDGPAGFNPATHLVGGLAAHVQTVGSDGLYQFLLQNDFPSGIYTLVVTAPGGYLPFPSTTIAPCVGVLNVTLTPNPALLQQFDNAPPSSAPAGCPGLVPGGSATTQYYLQFNITRGGSADILNNHIPLDPQLTGALFVTKTSPMVNVSRGDLVPYTITATNTQTTASGEVTIRDQLPPGFQYRQGTASRNGVKVEAVVANGFVTWPAETFQPKEKKTYTLMLVVGSGVSDGDYVNRAWGSPPGGGPTTNIAAATVRITPDPTFDCPDIIGKVFDDKNANGYQDDGEPGIPAVRVATANGLLITSDAEGRFHIPCPATPDMDRGSNFVLKLDPRTLPSGFRLTTENPASIRVTRGKMVKLNFGATIHRVVRVELTDAAFEANSTNLKAEYRQSLDTMPAALAERPSVVRVAYRYGADARDLAKKRIESVRAIIRDGWKAAKGRYALEVEAEESQ